MVSDLHALNIQIQNGECHNLRALVLSLVALLALPSSAHQSA